MTKASGVGERRKGRRSFSVSRKMSVTFPRQTPSEDADPLPAGNLLSGRLGGDQGGIEPDADDDDDDDDDDDEDGDGDGDDDDDDDYYYYYNKVDDDDNDADADNDDDG